MPSQWSVHNKAEKVTDSAHNTQSRDDIQSQKAGHLFSQSKKKKDQDKFPVMIFKKSIILVPPRTRIPLTYQYVIGYIYHAILRVTI